MPEMPEVETIRRGLQAVLVGKTITDITIRHPKMVRGGVPTLKKNVIGHAIRAMRRRGKLLIMVLDNDRYLLLHLKMTGQLIYQSPKQMVVGGHPWPPTGTLPNPYSHIIFTLEGKNTLFFNDQRQFGFVRLVTSKELTPILDTYGPEILLKSFTEADFVQRLGRRTVAIKTALLNQQLFAGIGNIYADEICFAARVHPGKKVNRLTQKEKHALFTAAKTILQAAIDHRGTTFSDYHDAHGHQGGYTALLQVYGRGGQPCRRCQTTLRKIKVGARGTVLCPHCQKR